MIDTGIRVVFILLAILTIVIIGMDAPVFEFKERISVWGIISFLIGFIISLLFNGKVNRFFLQIRILVMCCLISAIIVRCIMYARGYI